MVYAPIAPGLKQVALTYSVPAQNFPMSIPVEKETQIFEVLIEEEKGSVTAPKIKESSSGLLILPLESSQLGLSIESIVTIGDSRVG